MSEQIELHRRHVAPIWLERLTHNELVVGSNPTVPTKTSTCTVHVFPTGCSPAWSGRYVRNVEVVGSNPASPTRSNVVYPTRGGVIWQHVRLITSSFRVQIPSPPPRHQDVTAWPVSSVGRASPCHGEGRRIETGTGRQYHALVTQLAEWEPFKLRVKGSIPFGRTQ